MYIELDKIRYYKKNLIDLAYNEKIFLYPTDTIYWLWWIPTKKVTNKIFDIKWRKLNKPLSVIAPNINRIINYFKTPKNFCEKVTNYLSKNNWITIILEKKDPKFLPNIWKDNKAGIRIINHPIQKFVEELEKPFISTSANISDKDYIPEIPKMENKITKNVDIIINQWRLNWNPSRIIDFTNNEKIIR